MKLHQWLGASWPAAVCCVTFMASVSHANGTSHEAGRVVAIKGEARVERIADGKIETVAAGSRLFVGDVVQTADQSSTRLLMTDRSLLDLGAETRVTIQHYAVASDRTRQVSMKVWLGRMWARVAKATSSGGGTDFEVRSENAVAGVRGTEFVMSVLESGDTDVTVVSGLVAVDLPEAPFPTQVLSGMQRAAVPRGGATIQVSAVTAAQVQQLVVQTQQAAGQSASQGADGTSSSGEASSGKADGTSGAESADGNDGASDATNGMPSFDEAAPPPPPVDLDPGSGLGTIELTIEVSP